MQGSSELCCIAYGALSLFSRSISSSLLPKHPVAMKKGQVRATQPCSICKSSGWPRDPAVGHAVVAVLSFRGTEKCLRDGRCWRSG